MDNEFSSKRDLAPVCWFGSYVYKNNELISDPDKALWVRLFEQYANE